MARLGISFTEQMPERKKKLYGNQAKRLTAVPKGTGGILHRNGSDRPVGSGPGAVARDGRNRDIRAGRPLRMAHAPAGADPDRHSRTWLDAMLGRPHRGNQAG